MVRPSSFWISIRYGVLLEALAKANSVPPEGLAAFENRLKHLKRNGFPSGVNLGKTGRYDYSPIDVVGIASALRLMDAYVMPTTTISLVAAGDQQLGILALDRLVEVIGDKPGADVLGDDGQVAGEHASSRLRCAVFPGVALSKLGTMPAGAGRYDAPVNAAKLLTSAELGDETGLPGSGVVLRGDAAFDAVFRELDRLGAKKWRLAAGLLADLAPDAAIASLDDVQQVDDGERLKLWLALMALRLLGDGAALPAELRGQLVTLTGRLALATTPGERLLNTVIDDQTDATLGEVLVELLDITATSVRRWAGNWPSHRFHELAGRICPGEFNAEQVREWLLTRLKMISGTGTG